MGSYRRAAIWHQGVFKDPSTAEIAKAVALNDAFVDGLERLKDMAYHRAGRKCFPQSSLKSLDYFALFISCPQANSTV